MTKRKDSPEKARNDRLRSARRAIKAVRGGNPPPSTPAHALVRVARAAEMKTPLQCSRFGAPGGGYLAILERPKGASANEPAKVRRVERSEAHQVIRRSPGLRSDGIAALYWLPPEVTALYVRDVQVQMVLADTLRPVWTVQRGRTVQRGDSVLGQ